MSNEHSENTPQTLDQLVAELRKKADAATPGPWLAQLTPKGAAGAMCYADAVIIPVKHETTKPGKFIRVPESAIWCERRRVGETEWAANLRLIAAARTMVPALLDALQLAIEQRKYIEEIFQVRRELSQARDADIAKALGGNRD